MAGTNDDKREEIEDEEIDEDLLAATEKRMESAGMMDDDDEDDEIIVDDNEINDDQTVEQDDDDSSTLDDDDDDSSSQAEDDNADSSSTSEKSEDSQDEGIPDAYYRAAIHQGWTADEINALYEKDASLAVKTCKKLYDSTNKLSTEFANLGRAKIKQEEESNKEKNKQQPVDLKLDSLKEQYGEDSALVNTVEQIAKMLVLQNENKQQSTNNDKNTQNDDAAAARQLLTNFFGAPDMEVYADFYGKGTDENKWTQEQYRNRFQVANLADEIMIGAAAMGRDMSDEEALEIAHLQVTEPMRETVIRKRIKKELKKREKSITLKPQGNATNEKTDGKVTEDELERRTESRLAKLNFS